MLFETVFVRKLSFEEIEAVREDNEVMGTTIT